MESVVTDVEETLSNIFEHFRLEGLESLEIKRLEGWELTDNSKP